MVFKANFACSQRPLQEESERQLSKLGLDKSTDGLMGEGKDLLALLFPLVILVTIHMQQINDYVTKHSKYDVRGSDVRRRGPTTEAFSLYLNDSW